MVTSNIKKIMNDKGITIRGMVGKTGLSDVTILRARSEQIIYSKLSTLDLIAQCLGCKIKDLFDEE